MVLQPKSIKQSCGLKVKRNHISKANNYPWRKEAYLNVWTLEQGGYLFAGFITRHEGTQK